MKFGILLSGCGFYDGTEVAEAVLAALALERAGARVVYLAPDVDQMHTVDHLTGGESEEEGRRVLVEAARVARGKVLDLADPLAAGLLGLVIPGGHGAVKNLMTHFAQVGERRELIDPVRRLLDDLSSREVPIGSISLGRTIVRAFHGEPLSADDMQMPATEVLVDERRRLVFTPGFLTATSMNDVAIGIDRLVAAMMALSAPRLRVIPGNRPC